MKTILVVEDDAASRKALVEVLVGANFHCVEARDGVEAMSRLLTGPIDLVFTDILLPKLDGLELVRQIRSVPSLAATPVVFWTATYDQTVARRMAKSCGVDYFLSKPCPAETILTAVESALSAVATPKAPPGAEFDHEHVQLLSRKLTQKLEELEARRVGHVARPILLVEDNPMDIDFMLQAFEEHSVANPVRVCQDGEEAIDFINAHGTTDDPELPLLVLLDLRLPKVDGIEVLRHARELPVWNQIPFVVVTTSSENTEISRAYELGANSYIIKPVDFVSFSEVVKNIKTYWLLSNESPFPDPNRRRK